MSAIYIGLPEIPTMDTVRTVQLCLLKNIQKYYRNLSANDIKFYINNTVVVFVMDKAIYPDHDKQINDIINSVIMKYFPTAKNISITLNYGKFNPSFNPVKSSSLQSAAVASDKKPENAQQSSPLTSQKSVSNDEFDYEKLSENYQAEEPRYSFDQVILPESIVTQIEEAVGTIQVEQKVFDEWGLRTIIPNASSALSFYGPPGTGKSMAAEAIANKLHKKILRATYADIESKYHGEGPKMVKAIFRAAERDDAVLFLDESDSLLSKRLTNVTDGSAQAINSMRSQLLICLEQFRGIVIFATNLVVNYDKAFLSRLINIEFVKPDSKARYAIWQQHLKGEGLHIPLSDDVNLQELAENYEFCGREIKNSVKDACVSVAISMRDLVTQADLIKAAEKTKIECEKVLQAEDHTVSQKKLTGSQEDKLKRLVQSQLDKSKEIENIDNSNV